DTNSELPNATMRVLRPALGTGPVTGFVASMVTIRSSGPLISLAGSYAGWTLVSRFVSPHACAVVCTILCSVEPAGAGSTFLTERASGNTVTRPLIFWVMVLNSYCCTAGNSGLCTYWTGSTTSSFSNVMPHFASASANGA